MSLSNDACLQLKRMLPLLAASYVSVIGLLLIIFLSSSYFNIPFGIFTRDPIAVLDGHPATGVVSRVGILLWCATAAICFFAAALLGRNKDAVMSRFLMISGLFTSFLLLDDWFMFHEELFPDYLHIPQPAVYAGYLVLIAMYFFKFGKVIAATEYSLLLIACGFFALSIICDFLLPPEGLQFLLEDGLKLFGIVTWFLYFFRTCYLQIQVVLDR